MAHDRESILIGDSMVAEGSVNSLLTLSKPGSLDRTGSGAPAGVLDNVSGERELSSQLCSSLSAS